MDANRQYVQRNYSPQFSERVRSILLSMKYFDDLDILAYVRVSRILFLIWGD